MFVFRVHRPQLNWKEKKKCVDHGMSKRGEEGGRKGTKPKACEREVDGRRRNGRRQQITHFKTTIHFPSLSPPQKSHPITSCHVVPNSLPQPSPPKTGALYYWLLRGSPPNFNLRPIHDTRRFCYLLWHVAIGWCLLTC